MWPNISLSLLAVGEGQLSTPGWEVAVGERVGGVKGWVGVCWERGGSGEEGWGEALAFSSGIFLSVVLSFPFFLLLFFNPPFSFHGWRHGYQASLGTDNMVQTMASSPRWWWRGRDTERERGSETERGRPGQGHRGREGQNGALVFRARTLYSITLLSLLQTHILLFLQHTHTHHFNLTPFKWSTATLALQAALLTQIGNKLLSASHKNLVFKNCPFLYNYKTKANKYSNKQK